MDEIITGQRKAAPRGEVKLDTAGEGSFRAVYSTLNVVDLDNDVTLPGAFRNGQKVRIAQWGHAWGLPTIGTGVIDSDDSKAWVDGQFNLKTTAGRDTYESVKDAGDLQEWSYGFDITEWSIGDWEGQEVRFLKGLSVIEVSPVMLGAGIGTRTDTIKGLMTLSDQSEEALAALSALASRLRLHADLRTKEGRDLSQASRDRLLAHANAARGIADELEALHQTTAPAPKGRPAMVLRAEALLAELDGLGISLP